MNARRVPLVLALIVSLLLHAALAFVWGGLAPTAQRRAKAAPLAAVIVRPPERAEAQPPLLLPEREPAAPAAPPAQTARSGGRRAAPADESAVMRQAAQQIGRRLLYPVEAVERGIEGEALVLLFLDDAGNALAARLERSSGHAILDEAALRAAKEIRSLPGGATREVLLPVRFRLR